MERVDDRTVAMLAKRFEVTHTESGDLAIVANDSAGDTVVVGLPHTLLEEFIWWFLRATGSLPTPPGAPGPSNSAGVAVTPASLHPQEVRCGVAEDHGGAILLQRFGAARLVSEFPVSVLARLIADLSGVRQILESGSAAKM